MRLLLFLLLTLSLLPGAYAATGFEMVPVPAGSISKVETTIDTQIENVGFDRIFVGLPSGWVIDEISTFATSYAVLESGLWRKYGDPLDKTTPLGSGVVYKETGPQSKLHSSLNTVQGWWLRPNEGVIIHLAIDNFPCSGTIDPLSIEKANPSIFVRKWEQELTMTPSAVGFITAPCVVESAALTIASPAPISDVTQKPGTIYYQSYDPLQDVAAVQLGEVPSWDAWFTLTGSLAGILSKKSVVGLEPVFNKTSTATITTTTTVINQIPVWRIDDIRDITYAYQWERGKTITGINLVQATVAALASVPEWFDWF